MEDVNTTELGLPSSKKVLNGVVVHPSDAGDLSAAQALGEEVKKYVDHLDGAFLNPGIATFAPIEAETPKNYDDMFNVNVRGLYFQLQSLLDCLAHDLERTDRALASVLNFP